MAISPPIDQTLALLGRETTLARLAAAVAYDAAPRRRRMTLSQAIRLAAENGCEIEPAGDGKRVLIRSIGYDADPYELEEARIYAMTEEEFVREWIPPRYLQD